ncbi:hypothetical protein B0H19DRAFT_1109718 [Mycena capillaripes]|nr:hypothetical protein B0H19DRAFT_1109718 [Mycena capillaripes]
MPTDVQLLSTIILGSLSLIPNNVLRYTSLTSVIVFALVYNFYLNRAAWLHQLEQVIQQTEEIVERAKAKCTCPGDQFKLAQEWLWLLEVKQCVSEIRLRISETRTLTWKQYWHLKRRVAECTNRVNNIRTSVQVGLTLGVLEAELQRKLAEDITETRSALENARVTCAICQGIGPSTNQFNFSDQYLSANRSGFRPIFLYLRVNASISAASRV